MNISFEKMGMDHQKSVMEIFNYYISTSTAAFPNNELPEQFYLMLLKKSEGYPAYVIKDSDCIIGFCSLSAYNPFSTFKGTATLTYFISEKYGSTLKTALDN